MEMQRDGVTDEPDYDALMLRIKELTDDHSARAIAPYQKAFEPAPKDTSKSSFSFDDFAPSSDGPKQLPPQTGTAGESPQRPAPKQAEPDEETEVLPPEKDA
jgi:hypothetical protein